jgi:hypothetical protein
MATTSLARSSLKTLTKYDSFLVGNAAYIPSAFDSIATITGAGSPTTITFSSIPSTYKHLQVRFRTLASSSGADSYLRFNGVSTTTYDWHSMSGNGSAASAIGVPGDDGIRLAYGSDTSTTYPMSAIIDIYDYANTSKNKTVRTFAGQDFNGTYGGPVVLSSALWRSTSAITSLSINLIGGPTYSTSSIFSLYGIEG